MLTGYVKLLRENRNFRNLWLGAIVSQGGDWFNLIAAASLVKQLTDAETAVSALFLLRFLPLFLFSPIAGVLADRFDRRRLMIVADLVRAAIVLAILLVRSPEQLWLFYVLIALQFSLSALFIPARTAVIANIVPRKDLVTANALDSFTWSVMLALGALLGGVATSLLGIEITFLLDALTFLLSAVFVTRIVLPQQPVRIKNKQADSFLAGLRYLRLAPFILAISLTKGLGSLAWGAINVIEVGFAEDVFPLNGDGALTLGLLYAVSGLGTGVGPVLMRAWLGDNPRRLRQGITVGFGLLAAGHYWIVFVGSLGSLMGATLLRTVGSGTVWVFSAALLQTIVPDRFRGRVFAFEFAFLTATQSLSIFWAGFAVDTLGYDPRQVIGQMAIVATVFLIAWYVVLGRERPLLPEVAPDVAAS